MGVIDRRIAELGSGQYDVVGLDQLRELGINDWAVERRLADRRLYRLFRRVYAVGTPRVSQRGWWKAATLAVAPDGLLSHVHGAALRDLVRAKGPIDVVRSGAGQAWPTGPPHPPRSPSSTRRPNGD
jgi:hypothetical protein